MGLDQQIVIQGKGKHDDEEYYFRNFYALHDAIEKRWIDRGRQGENVYGEEKPNELIDMAITLQDSDLEHIKDIEVHDCYKDDYDKVLSEIEKAFNDARGVDYVAT